MNVLGIDLSLNGTGLAMLSIDEAPPTLPRLPAYPSKAQELAGILYQGVCISPVPAGVLQRWEAITAMVLAWAQHAHTVVIEGYSFGSNLQFATAIRELGGIVRYQLRKIGHTPVEVAPTSLKKFATGKGFAEKGQVIAAVAHRFGLELTDDNMADAFVLAKIGEALVMSDLDNARLPYHQREVIGAIKYPTEKVRKVRAPKLKFQKPVQARLGGLR